MAHPSINRHQQIRDSTTPFAEPRYLVPIGGLPAILAQETMNDIDETIRFIPQQPDYSARFPAIDQALEIAMQLPEGKLRTELMCKAAEKWLLLATPAPLMLLDPTKWSGKEIFP